MQGDFREHARVFGELGASPVEVRTPEDLARVDVLAIPGGESTTISKLACSAGLVEPIVEEIGEGVRVLAQHDERPVVLEQGNLVVASFHPELVGETGLHGYVLGKV